jgi:hypothetical protein
MAFDSRPRVLLCGRLGRIKKGWRWKERVFQSVANGDDSPAIGSSFKLYEIFAV